MKRKTVDPSGHKVSSVCPCVFQSSPLPFLFLNRKTHKQPQPRALHFLVCFWLAFQLLLLLPLSIHDDNKTTRKKKKKRVSLRNPDVAVNKSIVNNSNPNKNLKNKKQKEEKKSMHFEYNRNKQLSSATMTTMMVMSEEASSGSTLVIVAKHIGEEGS